jgi:hypothetical protein
MAGEDAAPRAEAERRAFELEKVEMFCAFTGVSSHTSHYRPPIQLAATFPYTFLYSSLPPYAFAGADRRTATAVLARVGWELEAATDLFFEAGFKGVASEEGAGGAACHTGVAEDAQAEHLREVARSLADCSDPELKPRRLMEMVMHMPPDQYAALLAHAGLDEEQIRTTVQAMQQMTRDPARMQNHMKAMELFNWPGQC